MKTGIALLGLTMFVAIGMQAQLNGPEGIIFDSTGGLWVANSISNNVEKIDPLTGAVLATITAGLNGPTRLAFDTPGNLYVVNEAGNSVTVYDPNLHQITNKTISHYLSRPSGVTVDAYADVFVSNNLSGNLLIYNIDGNRAGEFQKDRSGFKYTAPNALTISGNRIYAGFGSDSGEDAVISYNVGEFLTNNPKERIVYTDGKNTGPTGIALDSSGYVYVSEYYSNSWVKFDPHGKLLFAITTGVLQPQGIAVDGAGNVYVANSTPSTITVYNPAGQLIRTLH